jgi:hypothetical protein
LGWAANLASKLSRPVALSTVITVISGLERINQPAISFRAAHPFKSIATYFEFDPRFSVPFYEMSYPTTRIELEKERLTSVADPIESKENQQDKHRHQTVGPRASGWR